MSVTTYDKSFSFRQDTVARLGEGRAPSKMTAEQQKQFQSSPFMKEMKELESAAWARMSQRDKQRQKIDPNFKPQDGDFDAPKSFQFVKTVDYYKCLGVDEYATLDEIKKVYKKLSLAYHPDKLSGLSQEEKDERAAIFIEVKNAYKVLSDNPTRRQYDYERDKDAASRDKYGSKKKEEVQFDAREFVAKLQEKAKENQKLPSETVDVVVKCKLEKFVHGGHKAISRERRVKVRVPGGAGMEQVQRLFRVEVPPRSKVPSATLFRNAGDMHVDRDPDTLRFLMQDKPHDVVSRSGDDFHLRTLVEPPGDWSGQPFLSVQVPSVRGRHVLLWGENPFMQASTASASASSTAWPESGTMSVKIGQQGASTTGRLHAQIRVGLKRQPATSHTAGSSHSTAEGGAPATKREERDFLDRFELGPSLGFRPEQQNQDKGLPSVDATLFARRQRQAGAAAACEVELEPFGNTVVLHTSPQVELTFLSNRRQLSQPDGVDADRRLPAPAMFAIALSSRACAPKRGAQRWQRLLTGLVPVLQLTAFRLIADARALLPRRILRSPQTVDFVWLDAQAPLLPLKRMGDDAYRRDDVWQAMACYSKALEEMQMEELRQPDSQARLHSNRSACLARVKEWSAAVDDAKKAVDLAPTWSRGWRRLALAAGQLQGDFRQESLDAAQRAAALEPCESSLALLSDIVRKAQDISIDYAHEAKERGNEAFKGSHDFGLAASWYTMALAVLPAPPPVQDDGRGASNNREDDLMATAVEDEHALLRAVLYTNRSAALAHLRQWEMSINDARLAVRFQATFVKARSQLALSLLAAGRHEQAYVEFARCLQLDSDSRWARKGRTACLHELTLWKSAAALQRMRTRSLMDAQRPRASSRIFAISDVHYDTKPNEAWVHELDDFAFQDDVLLVAGNLAGSKVGCLRALSVLKAKFRRVFYLVGSYEMDIHLTEVGRCPDSIAKMLALYEACDEIGIDTFPAAVCEGVYVVPLQSWYNSEFDEQDPFPDPNEKLNSSCRWPVDADSQVWRYMAKLNERAMSFSYPGTVISMSHFLPRRGLPFTHEPERTSKGLAKTVGNEVIDEQLRLVGSKLHVFGHGRKRCDAIHSGVRYVSMPLLFEKERGGPDADAPLMLVYNGKATCSQQWGCDGVPPDGVLKRLFHIEFFNARAPKPQDIQKLKLASEKLGRVDGVQSSLCPIGSKTQSLPELTKDIWPELETLRMHATHALLLVADNTQSLKACLSDPAYREWQAEGKKVMPFGAGMTFIAPLGQDLQAESKLPNGAVKEDPCLAVWFLRLQEAVTEDSAEYEKMQKAVKAINNLPNCTGRIAASLQCGGYGSSSMKELLADLDVLEDRSYGFTHEFLVQVNTPDSLKLLLKSKTFEKWRASYTPHVLGARGSPGELAFLVPLSLQAQAAAPREDKSRNGKAKR